MASVQCKWMYADAGLRRSPFGAAVARKNPFRWSACMDPESCIDSLRMKAENRPVLLRVFDATKDEKFIDMQHATVSDAIGYLQQVQGQPSSPSQAASSQPLQRQPNLSSRGPAPRAREEDSKDKASEEATAKKAAEEAEEPDAESEAEESELESEEELAEEAEQSDVQSVAESEAESGEKQHLSSAPMHAAGTSPTSSYAQMLLNLAMPYKDKLLKEVRRPKIKSQLPLALCPLLCGLVLAYNFYDSSPDGLRLRDNADFKICTSVVTITFTVLYRMGCWAARTFNDDGLPVRLGKTVKESAEDGLNLPYSGAHKFYCGRFIPIPGSDGQCGTHNGPQCPACASFQNGPFKVWLLQTKWSSRLPKWIPLKRWPVDDVKYYVKGIKENLEIAWWLAPSISLAVFFMLWGASEQDLDCGPESWGPMIPLVAQFYLPPHGSPADNKLRTALLTISVFCPFFKAPSVLLPSINTGVPDIVERRAYFGFEFVLLLALTCLLLELGRGLSKKIVRAQLVGLSESLLNNVAATSSEHNIREKGVSREYKIAFGSYYALYQILLYALLDYAVAHGNMNLGWGIAWELWMCFFQMVCFTGLLVGISWYIYSARKRKESPHPTPLLLMQLTPWVGNELHVMKDHIAQALCFACAHCQTGSLRAVGLMLGYLSICATFFPLYFMLRDADAFTTLRSGHWPIPEASYMHHVKLASVRNKLHEDGNSFTDKILMATVGEKRMRQTRATITQTMITCCTEDKLLRAVVGEMPHAVLHVNFAYFFGGGLFIFSAIILSAVRVLLIPICRELLKSEIPKRGCSEQALKTFFTFGKKLNWAEPEDAIVAASKYGWNDALEFVRVLAPRVDDIFGQDVEAFELKLEDLPKKWNYKDIVDKLIEYANEHSIDLSGVSAGIEHIHVYTQTGECLVIGSTAPLKALDKSCFPLNIQFPQSKLIQELLVHAAQEGAKATPENPAAGQAEYYIGLIRVLRDQLGVYMESQAKITVDQVVRGEVSVNCLQYLKEIDKMAGGVSVYGYVNQLAHGQQGLPNDVQVALERAATSLQPPQSSTDEAMSRAKKRKDEDESESDGEETRLVEAKQFEEINYYLMLASICIPAMLMVIVIVIRHF